MDSENILGKIFAQAKSWGKPILAILALVFVTIQFIPGLNVVCAVGGILGIAPDACAPAEPQITGTATVLDAGVSDETEAPTE